MGRRSRRQEIGAEVIAKVQSGRTAKEVADEYGLKVKTVYNWVFFPVFPCSRATSFWRRVGPG